MNRFLKRLYFLFCEPFFPFFKKGSSILMYHSVSLNKAFFTVTPENFEQQLIYLKRNGFEVVFLSVFLEDLKRGRNLKNKVVITFDDGYADNYFNVLPLLKKHQIPLTIFIVSDLIGRNMKTTDLVELPILNREQILEMIESGLVEIMPHTEHHKELNIIKLECFPNEIELSRQKIEAMTNKKASILAYPRGKYNNFVIDYLRQNNWSGAVTVHDGLVSNLGNIFELPRNSIDSSTSFSEFKGKLNYAIQIYDNIKKCLKL